jgi:hypothetical protein
MSLKQEFIEREWLMPHTFTNYLLVGKPGTGKSTICSQLVAQNPKKYRIVNYNGNIDLLLRDVNQALLKMFNLSNNNNNLFSTLDNIKEIRVIKKQKHFIIIDNIDSYGINDICKSEITMINLIAKVLPSNIKLITTLSNNENLVFDFNYNLICLDFNDYAIDTNTFLNNSNIQLDTLNLIEHILRQNDCYLFKILINQTNGNTKLIHHYLNILIIKSQCNFLFINLFFDLIKSYGQNLSIIDSIGATLNGLYLHILNFLFEKCNLLVNTDLKPRYSVSNSSLTAWVYGVIVENDDKNQDLFHLILNYLIHYKELDQNEFYQMLKFNYENLNEDTFNLVMDLIRPILFKTTSTRNELSLRHSSLANFLKDIKFSTIKHYFNITQMNYLIDRAKYSSVYSINRSKCKFKSFFRRLFRFCLCK